MKFVNDIVHGMINLPNYIAEIIDTKHFQRLRSICQLGFTSFVYPTTTNTRFEHCIGTFHLASILIRQLQKQTKDEKLPLEISDEDVKCVEIAALCHDLGHGPYSHLWESCIKMLLKNLSDHKSHEKLSCEIFELLINTTKSGENIAIKEKLELNDTMIDLICRLILGKYNKAKDNSKRFLFEIIANKDSGLDVDKFDYLCRDTIHLGWSNTDKIRDIKRIIHFLRVIEHKGEYRLATRDREIFQIHDIFYSRHLLHRYGYQHKTTKAIECMFKNALESIVKNHLDELIISVIGENEMNIILVEMNRKEEILCSKEFISKVCDYHIWNMMSRYAQEIVNKIHERNILKLIFKLQITVNDDKHYPDLNDDINQLELDINDMISTKNDKKPVMLSLTKFSLASESGDPIFKIPFYKKSSPAVCFNFDDTNRPSGLVELIKSEYIVMVFIDPEMRQNKSIVDELNKIKNNLCVKSNDGQFKDICDKYHFKESNY